MRWILRQLKRLVIALAALAVLLLAPVVWTEAACRGEVIAESHVSILPPEHRRDESRTYTTYPEWHIVHAYEDYSKVISTQDPHDFSFLRAISGFWSALCPLAQKAAAHGGFTNDSKITIYTIGVSFTAELAAKALYEETAGRIATMIRGKDRAPLDNLSAEQAHDYAVFLRQTPWYRWDFRADAAELKAAATPAPRDRERAVALGLEFRAKAAYADVIAEAVQTVGADELTIRSVVVGLAPDQLSAIDGVTVIGDRPDGTEIETARYRAFTAILARIAAEGGDFVEIAGNDDILLTVISRDPVVPDVIHRFRRQGFGDWRHLVEVRVADLAERLRTLEGSAARLEHIHDY